jgi:branched-chain amino acid transport system substrate-binding protein
VPEAARGARESGPRIGKPRRAIRTRFAAGLVAAACLLAPARADAPLVVAIGLDLPISGIDGASGIPARNAVVLAIEEANRRGFPGGARVALHDLDDTVQGKHDPAQGAQNMRTFAADDAVVAVVGPLNSNVAEAEIPIANDAGFALISMGATAIGLTKGPAALRLRPAHPDRPSFFRVCASDDRQGAAAAAFARRRGVRRAFVIDDNESYGKGIADVFASEFPRRGGAIVGREHLTQFALDYKPLLTKVAALRPDVVFFGGIVSTGGAILRKQMGDVGLGRIPYFGGDGLASPDYVPLAGAYADATYFTLAAPDVTRSASARAFVAAYRARFRADPANYSATAYVAARIELAAVRDALAAHPGRAPDRAEILDRVARTRLAVTPAGPVSFDRAGDLADPVVSLYEVSGGQVHFVAQAGAGAE